MFKHIVQALCFIFFAVAGGAIATNMIADYLAAHGFNPWIAGAVSVAVVISGIVSYNSTLETVIEKAKQQNN